jgi:hypothetical protein
MLSLASRAFSCVYSTNNPVDCLANVVPPEYALTYTVLIPLHVSGATEYAIDTSLLSPPLNDITDDAITVSTPQLDTAEIVTVYLPFPDEQFVMRLKIPTLSPPAVAVGELTVGVVTIAHPVEPPPPPLPRCANKGSATNTRHTRTNVGLTRQFFIHPPRLID